MGRDAGYIALNSGIACGAEDILLPEVITDINEVLERIDYDERRRKTVHILVVAEGDDYGGAGDLMEKIKDRFPKMDIRAAILGHIQRGGAPTYADRVLASRLGYAAVLALKTGKTQVMAGIVNGEVVYTPFAQAVKKNSEMSADMLEMIRVLAV